MISIGKKSNNGNDEESSTRRSSSASVGSYYIGNVKELPKIHHASVANNVDGVVELASKQVKAIDRSNRCVCVFVYLLLIWLLFILIYYRSAIAS